MSDYNDLDATDDLDDPGELGDDVWDDGFGRGWTAAQALAARCCEHQPDCPAMLARQPWWRRALVALRGSS